MPSPKERLSGARSVIRHEITDWSFWQALRSLEENNIKEEGCISSSERVVLKEH